MSYQVLSRKYRPQRFDDLVGQDHVATTLRNAIERDRVAHAYMFTGPRGVGKTSTARILAKSLNCPNRKNYNPCNSCTSCEEITRSSSMDVMEIDGASNRGIDEIRELREAVKYPPTSGTYRIYIIDEVHMLTQQAFNALLKTLEEPPPHVKFLLATTDPQKVPQTILSRTQRFDFRRIPVPVIAGYVRQLMDGEGLEYEDAALNLLARKADGSMRDCLSLLDQVIAFQSGRIDEQSVIDVLGLVPDAVYADLLTAFSQHERGDVLNVVDKVFDAGHDLREFAAGLNQYLRDAIVTLETGSAELTSRAILIDIPTGITSADLLNFLNLGMETESKLRYSQQARVLLEYQLLKMADMDRVVSITQVLERLDAGGGSGGGPGGVDERAKHTPGEGAEPVRHTTAAHSNAEVETPRPAAQPKPSSQPSTTARVRSDQPEIPPDALDQIRKAWVAIVEAVRSESNHAAALLDEAEPAGIEAKALTIHLPASEAFHLKMLMDKKPLIEEKIRHETGLVLSVFPTIPESASRSGGTQTQAGSGHAGSDKLIDTFKGKEY